MHEKSSQARNELEYWLALLRAPKLGPATFLKLVEAFPKLSELFALKSQELAEYGIVPAIATYLQQPDWRAVDQDLAWAAVPANTILTCQDAVYPKLLREITGAPPVIYVQGDPGLLASPQLAMVGSRNPTPAGADSAHQFAHFLASSGLTITSGLALGIDAASHRGTLAAKGLTIAVTGAGLDCIYPAQHRALAGQIIAAGGALVSEFPPGTMPRAENFPRRNRLISGLSMGVLVVEAALRSGSLITAKYALEQGREVFAIPGSIHNPLARGCHALLRQGAKLVETGADVLEELSPLLQFVQPAVVAPAHKKLDLKRLGADYAKLMGYVDFAMTSIDTLIARSGLPAEAVSSMLILLELQGYVTAVPGGYLKLNEGNS